MKTTNGIRYLLGVLCLGSGLLAPSAHAAKVQLHSQSLLPGFGQLSNELEGVAEVFESEPRELQVVHARLTLKADEKLAQALKQTLYVSGAREGGSMLPAHVGIAAAKAKDAKQGQRVLSALGAPGKTLEIFSYSAGNPFGECTGLVFTRLSDALTVDATFIGACQSE